MPRLIVIKKAKSLSLLLAKAFPSTHSKSRHSLNGANNRNYSSIYERITKSPSSSSIEVILEIGKPFVLLHHNMKTTQTYVTL